VTNLGSIPQIPAGTAFILAAGASWLDAFYVQQPGYPAAPLPFLGTVTNNSPVVALNSVAGITAGCLVQGYGIPLGAQVINVVGSPTNTITLNQSCFVPVTATNVPIQIWGPPLDLTGISFASTVRENLTSATVLLAANTGNGLMINGGGNGSFGWQVSPPYLPHWPFGVTQVGGLGAVVDIQASDASGQINDLTGVSGPLPITVVLAAPPAPAMTFQTPMITVGP
jgi:hypothetical protein